MAGTLVLSVSMCSVLGTLLGYDIGIISGAIIFVREDLQLSIFEAEIIVGSLNLVSAVGGLCAGSIADNLGRRGAISLATSAFLVGTIFSVAASSFAPLFAGRVIMGLGVGIGCVVGPLYAAELSPPAHRGALASLFEVAIGFGILLGYAVAYGCRDLGLSSGWRVMLGCGGILPLGLLSCLVFLPESPRYLWAIGQPTRARDVLSRVMDAAEVDSCCADIDASVKLTSRSPWAVVGEILCPRSAAVRMMVVVGFGVSISQQANGSEAVVYYMPTILSDGGVTNDGGSALVLKWTVLVGIIRTIMIATGCALVDRWGRRPLLLVSTAGVCLSLCAIARGSALGADGLWLTITGLCCFMGSYAIGLGPVNMVLLSEIFPFRLRATAMSLALCANRLVSGIVASSFLSLTEAISTPGAFLLFAGIALLCFLFVLRYVPETKGRSLEEMEAFFEQLVGEGRPLAGERRPLAGERRPLAGGGVKVTP